MSLATEIAEEPRLDHAVIDQIRELEAVRPGLFQHLAASFDAKTTGLLAETEARLAARDLEYLRIAFHSLKGTAGSLGLRRLSVIAGMIENAIMGNTKAGSPAEILDHLHVEFAESRLELRQLAVG